MAALSADFAVEIHVAALRLKYLEPHRHVLIRLELDAADNWLLRPETIGWWENRRGRRYPLAEDERAGVIERVVVRVRERHRLWLNVSGRPLESRPATWPDAPPIAFDAEFRPEVFAAAEGADLAEPKPEPSLAITVADAASVLVQIDTALARIEPLAAQNWAQAQSIARQLRWCRGKLRGESVETPPGPFSMGLIATREFDMYGSDPDFARLINDIEDQMRCRGWP